MKERTQTSTEMGISCQRNVHWAMTNHLSGRGLVQPIKELLSAAGRCAGRGCVLIRQLANWHGIGIQNICTETSVFIVKQ